MEFDVGITRGTWIAFIFLDVIAEKLRVAVERRGRRIDLYVEQDGRIVVDVSRKVDLTSDTIRVVSTLSFTVVVFTIIIIVIVRVI